MIIKKRLKQIYRKKGTEIAKTKKLPLEYGTGLGSEPGIDVLGNLWEEVHAYKKQVQVMVVGSEEWELCYLALKKDFTITAMEIWMKLKEP
ncbi:hypothetical protein [Clostridium cellulovorans]|uniref:Uncharacterized protein n=1 Tax=Clostridium cellulovorans (strain ATCC 35296 / DSM 3052 / OCM 3 / 743B) TaxID=573061 RepID=D9SUZ6_CLOC7|nr:hypothetical protein [Clostridium cellulovorans]ADL52971.1 hypothetical protein Clocel_3288 [Clostridium cellulovorans 743B]